MEDAGLISIVSAQNVPMTAAKFSAAAKQAGLTIFGQHDFSKAMEGANRPGPTLLISFGNQKVIHSLVSGNQKLAIDLPMKVLVWEGPDGVTSVSYTDPRWLMKRHGMAQQLGNLADNMASVLSKVVKNACSNEAVS